VNSLVDALNVDCRDPRLLADFWASVLGYRLEDADDMSASIVPDGRASITCDQDGVTLKSRPDAISVSAHRTSSSAESE